MFVCLWGLAVDGAETGSYGVDVGDLLHNENGLATSSYSDWIHCQRCFCYFIVLKVGTFMWPTLLYYEEGQFLRSTYSLYLGLTFNLLKHSCNFQRIRHEECSVRVQPKLPFATISYNKMAETGNSDTRAPLAPLE